MVYSRKRSSIIDTTKTPKKHILAIKSFKTVSFIFDCLGAIGRPIPCTMIRVWVVSHQVWQQQNWIWRGDCRPWYEAVMRPSLESSIYATKLGGARKPVVSSRMFRTRQSLKVCSISSCGTNLPAESNIVRPAPESSGQNKMISRNFLSARSKRWSSRTASLAAFNLRLAKDVGLVALSDSTLTNDRLGWPWKKVWTFRACLYLVGIPIPKNV